MFAIATRSRQHMQRRVDACETCAVRDIAACAALDGDERRRLTSIMGAVDLRPHRTIFDETEPATHVFTITEGVVKIYKTLMDGRCQITGFLFPGDFLGLVNGNSYAYSAETLTVTRLCRFPRRKLETLLEELPRLEQRLLGMASHEIAAAQDQMVLLGRKSARERVASFLLMLSKAATRHGQTGDVISLPMSRADIADFLGLTMETVSRKLTEFNAQRSIKMLNDKRICMVNTPALQRIAMGN